MRFNFTGCRLCGVVVVMVLNLCGIAASIQESHSVEAFAAESATTVGRKQTSPAEVFTGRTLKLRNCSIGELTQMRHLRHLGIGVGAEWELWRRQLPVGGMTAEIRSGFCGFLNGRLRSSVPEWWSNRLEKAVYDRDEHQFYLGFHKLDVTEAKRKILDTSGVTVTRELRHILLQSVEKKLIINSDHFLRDVGKTHALRGCEAWYVADYDDTASPFKLYAFDDGGSTLWVKEVWGSGIASYSGTGHFHLVDLCQSADSVLVFGASGESVYFEVFRKNDGRALCRWSTSY